jgi:hypothetical protein
LLKVLILDSPAGYVTFEPMPRDEDTSSLELGAMEVEKLAIGGGG